MQLSVWVFKNIFIPYFVCTKLLILFAIFRYNILYYYKHYVIMM